MRAAFLFELRRDRGIVLWMTAVATAYAAVMALFWPMMRDNASMFEQYMDIFPEGFLIAFGMEGSLADPGVFFTTYIGSWLWPIIAALVGIILATRPVAVDLERGFLELPLTTALSRRRYLAAVIAAQALSLAFLSFVNVMGFWVAATIVGAPYQLDRMLVVTVLAWLFACAIAACASMVSVLSLSRAIGGGVVAAVLLVMYLFNIVAQIQPDLGVLGDLSAFKYFRPTPLIDRGELPLVDVTLFAVISVAGWGLALWAFKRRNLAA